MPGLPDRGDRIGHTLKGLGDKPFWWLSPSGRERLLFWMAGRGYSWFHGLNTGSVGRTTRDQVFEYLRELVESGFAYDMVQVRYTIGGDNGPVDRSLPSFAREWNDTYDAPRVVINTADAFFAEFERRWGDSLPVRSGDMTPYWEDGALSSAAEEAMVRSAVRRLELAEALWSMRSPAKFPAAEANEAWRQALLWHEHTWGAADSISQPDRADVVAQWDYKRSFAAEADRRATALLAAAQPAPPKPPVLPDPLLEPAREARDGHDDRGGREHVVVGAVRPRGAAEDGVVPGQPRHDRARAGARCAAAVGRRSRGVGGRRAGARVPAAHGRRRGGRHTGVARRCR